MGNGKQRLDGEGSVYRRASDGRWVGSVSLGRGPDGKRRRRTVYGATRAEALAKRDAVRDELRSGARVATRRKGSLDDYLETWISATLRSRVAAGDLRETTRAQYADKLRRYVIGTRLGRMQLEEIRPADVREWLGWLSTRQTKRRDPATGEPALMSPGGVRIVFRVLRSALQDAVDDEVLRRTPTTGVKPPKGRGRKADPLTVDEAVRVLDAAESERLRALWVVFLYLGLRHGEAIALEWRDVDLDAGILDVSRTTGWITDPETRKRRRVEGDPKTDDSEAPVPLPAVVVRALEQHRAAQVAERLASPVWARPELVFASEAGTLLDNANVRRQWLRICQAAGVRPRRIHDLRHTTASLLYRAGVPVETISEILRHGSKAVTAEIYTHVFGELRRDAVEALDGLLISQGKAHQ